MLRRTLWAAVGFLASGIVGCGTAGDVGPQGPAGPAGTYQVGPGLTLKDGVLSVSTGTTDTTVVAGNDTRLSDARPPLAGSGSYIQNGTTPQDASLTISGTATAKGPMTSRTNLRVDAQADVANPLPLLRVENSSATAPIWANYPLFTVDSAGGLLARGELGLGKVPMSGKGLRLMWHPSKAAFRAGGADTEWDDATVGNYSWAGGNASTASGYGTFAMGDHCVASATGAACFGSTNQATGTVSFASGASTTASGFAATAMGYTVSAQGQGSVAIGYRVVADADYATAMGTRVNTGGHLGSFIWGDNSTTTIASNSADNQFLVRAAGGVRLRTSPLLTTGCDLPAGSGVFACTSDRNQKEDFRALDGEEVLAKVARLSVDTWRYKEEAPGVRHLGPVAQDFRAAFGLGTDDKSIGMLDIDGVNMAAIQALERRTQELRARTAEVDTLKAELAELKRGLSRLEATVQARGHQP
ncbi:tail fiber domain-containing protein [Myxococcaceae bacterium JPH2]|nr:tail fiber domain-containing protein [Myxococcaceae bacterium JPH2]